MLLTQWMPQNVSTFGGDIDSVFLLIYYIVGVWFIAAEVLLIGFTIAFRRRPGQSAAYIRGDTWSQLAWVVVPCIVVLGLDFFIDARSAPVWANIKEQRPEQGLQIGVKAKQFNWAFTNPGPDGQLGTADDFTLDNELHVPVNENILVTLESDDVLHSFYIPAARLKQDVLPGRKIKAWFNISNPKPERYELPCAELCGFGHYTMRGFLVTHAPDEYKQWVAAHAPKAEQ
jgi:cytochrome c oxidase subunit 2